MAKTLKDLVLALLNATLILVAVCLFLVLRVTTKVDGLRSNLTEDLQIVRPLREDLKATRSEIRTMREDFQILRSDPTALESAAMMRLQEKMTAVDERLTKMQTALAGLTALPNDLVDQAVASTADQIVDGVARIKGCVPPEKSAHDS